VSNPKEVCKGECHSIKKYDVDSGAYLGDFVSAGAGGLSTPIGLAVGPDGNVYVSSQEAVSGLWALRRKVQRGTRDLTRAE